jgi:hypothetical protein
MVIISYLTAEICDFRCIRAKHAFGRKVCVQSVVWHNEQQAVRNRKRYKLMSNK